MKIDIHTHTRKCKSGDAPTREISAEEFCDVILSTDVKIVAITNHNFFDLVQYLEIRNRMDSDVQVWPGIELDVIEEGSRGHLLVIVSPSQAITFAEIVSSVTENSTPDTFSLTVDEVLSKFEELRPLYVAHYKQKKPNISDDCISQLLKGAKNPSRVLKEVTNSISAGIYISHGHASIYGSDVHDWKLYQEIALDLPELRLAVDSFEQFCLLLEKDSTTINTALHKKTAQELLLYPFEDGTLLKINTFNDINIVFGPKGTGKSCILQAIAKSYCDDGIDCQVFVSSQGRLEDDYDIKGKNITLNLNSLDINYCSDEIGYLRNSSEVGVTSLSKFISYFTIKSTNKNAKRILIKDIDPEEGSTHKREFETSNMATKTTARFIAFLNADPSVKNELQQEELAEVTRILTDLLSRLTGVEWSTFSRWKEIILLNAAIDVFRIEIERKTGSPAKPTTTGFRDYALNRAKIEKTAAEILKSIDSEIPIQLETVGSLGPDKGELKCITKFRFQIGNIADSKCSSMNGIKKGAQKAFVKSVRNIHSRAYSEDLFQFIAQLNAIEDGENIKTVYELLLFSKWFEANGKPYTPSSGESSMLMLQKELHCDKDVYILDEPEKSLGNEYINDVIVPLINERAKLGKKVFISTHDANIAVRTLPYSSIYRCHGPRGYGSYIGNPFSNDLINPDNEIDRLDWKKVSMRTLEGGAKAFGERGKIYGNT